MNPTTRFFRWISACACLLMLMYDAERVCAQSGLPSLTYRLVELSTLELSWRSSDPRVVLESSEKIDDCIPWRAVPIDRPPADEFHTVEVPSSASSSFYQLHRLPESNLPPTLCRIGDRTITVGERMTLDLQGIDPNRTPLKFTAEALPPNSHFDTETGRFTFQPTPRELGDHTIEFGATDGTTTDTESIRVTVKPLTLRHQLLDDGSLRLSWTNHPSGFVLEQSPRIGESNDWSLATGPIRQFDNRNQVEIEPSEGSRFFRLRLVRVPPLFVPMAGSYSVPLGTDVRFTLAATDGDGDPLTFAAENLPLPEGARLDGLTGEFSWRPGPTQVGTHVVRFIVTDGLHVQRQTVSLVVPEALPEGVTRLTGRILDTTDAVAGRERPVVGARVSLLGGAAFATSDAAGRFVLNDIPAGKQVLDIDTSGAGPAPDLSPYAAFREEIRLIPLVDNVVGRPFYLPRIDLSSLTTVDPDAVTTVRNTNLNVTLVIPPHSAKMNGEDYRGPITISLVPSALAPAALPEFLQPSLLVTIQPMGVTYATPAAISFPNSTAIKEGNRANIWSLDAGTGQFTVVGLAEPAGDSLRTVAGGIRANDWHTAMPFACPAENAPQLHATGSQCPTCPLSARTGSSTALASGLLTTDFSLPPYVSMNQARSLRFVYNSLSAYPYHLLSYGLTLPVVASVPGRIEAALFLEDTLTGKLVSASTGLNEDSEERISGVVPASLGWLPTGSYRYTLRFCNFEPLGGSLPGLSRPQLHSAQIPNITVVQAICSYSRGILNHFNGVQDNLYGVGWGISDLQRLHLLPDNNILLSYGDGALARFEARGTKPFTVGVWKRVHAGPGFGLSFGPDEAFSKAYRSLTNNYPRATVKTFDRLTPESLAGVDFVILTDVNFEGHPSFRPIEPSEQEQLRAFVEAGGGALLLPGLEPSLSLLAPFRALVGSDPHSINGLGEQRIPISSPEFSLVTSGRHGTVFDLSKNRDLFLTRYDDALKALTLKSVAYQGFTVGTDLAVAPANQFKIGSGPVVIVTDPTAFADVKETGDDRFVAPSDLFDRNETLFLNIVDYCIQRIPEPTTPDSYRSPRGDFTRLSRGPDGTFSRSYDDGTVIRFDARGLQTAVADRHGNTTLFEYDGQQRLIRVQDPVGLTTELRYANSRLHEVIDPTGRTTAFEYDALHNLARVVFPDRSSLGYGYDQWHLLTTETNALGHVSTHQFDAYGRMNGAVRPDGSRQIITPGIRKSIPDPAPNLGTLDTPLPPVRTETVLSSLTEVLGTNQFLTTTFRTGVFGEPTETTDAAGLRSQSTRDALGQPKSLRSPSGHDIENDFDHHARLLQSRDPLFGATNSIRYEPVFHQVAAVTDALGNTSTNAYDERGNLTLAVSPMGRTTAAAYNTRGQPVAVTNTFGLASALAYDNHGNLISLTLGEGAEARSITSGFTPQGHLAFVADPLGQTTHLSYDTMGRATNQIFADGTSVQLNYDAAGQLSSISPPGRPAHTFKYTSTGLLEEYTAPDLGDNQNKTRYQYNMVQQLIRVTRPDGLHLDYAYDAAGRLARITNSRGATTFTYDARTGLLVTNTSPDGVTTSYQYQGELITKTLWSGVVTGSLSRSYDPNYRLRSSQANDGPVITYDYDKDGLLTRAGDLLITHDSRSGLVVATTNGVVTTSTSYDQFGLVTNHIATSKGQPVLTINILRDKLGRIIKKREVTRSKTNEFRYRYDIVGRLTYSTANSSSEPETNATYEYDQNGNRTNLVTSHQTIAAVYDAQDRLLSRKSTDLDESYTYSPAGELKSKVVNSLLTLYSHNTSRDLIAVTLPSGDRISYVLDARSRRVLKLVNDQPVRICLFDERSRPLVEIAPQTKTSTYYVYPDGQKTTASYIVNNFGTFRLITDHVGSIRMAINTQSGEIARQADYDEWGNVLKTSGDTRISVGFAGGIADDDTALHRFGVRDYDSTTSRWIATASLGPLESSANAFSYCNSDPVNRIDPSGRDLIVVSGTIHPSIIIPNRNQFGQIIGYDQYDYYSKGYVSGKIGDFLTGVAGKTRLPANDPFSTARPMTPGGEWLDYVYIPTSTQEEALARHYADSIVKKPGTYFLIGSSCVSFVKDVLWASGLEVSQLGGGTSTRDRIGPLSPSVLFGDTLISNLRSHPLVVPDYAPTGFQRFAMWLWN